MNLDTHASIDEIIQGGGNYIIYDFNYSFVILDKQT